MTYFHMETHTIIGAEQFHFWVRDGFRWFPLAIVARQTERKNSADFHQHMYFQICSKPNVRIKKTLASMSI